ncbi:hypothetical protein ZWY2020_028388 [Hordeum vulgare]|nr:hypothetical protein ZWY2020_028388 [Hordeum vulgare]
MARTASVMMLLMFLMLIFGVHLASAARPLEGEGWSESGIGTLARMLGGIKQSVSSPPTHCC